MKSIRKWILAILLVSPAIFAFTEKPGGEGYEIYLNNTMLAQQFGKNIDDVKSLSLSSASQSDQLVIKYHHCGQVGKNRVVTIKDGQDKILKEFKYVDGKSSISSMSVPVKDLLALKAKSHEMKLFYTSSELPKGRVLLLLKPTGGTLVKR